MNLIWAYTQELTFLIMHDAKQSLPSGIDREKWYVKQLLEQVLILQARGEKHHMYYGAMAAINCFW